MLDPPKCVQVRELLGRVLGAEPRHHKALHLLALVEARGDSAAKLRARGLWRCQTPCKPHKFAHHIWCMRCSECAGALQVPGAPCVMAQHVQCGG